MRIYPPEGSLPLDVEALLSPGDYAFLPDYTLWVVRSPSGTYGTLKSPPHKIEEHLDGTITVTPSIQFMIDDMWHGYLEKGVWRL